MSENQEPSTQKDQSNEEIRAERLARMEIEHKKQQSDHRAAFSDYQIEHRDEVAEGDDSIIQPSQTVEEIRAERLARMEIENTRYPGEDEGIVNEKSNKSQSKNSKAVDYTMKEGMLDSLETLLPKEEAPVDKKEESKNTTLIEVIGKLENLRSQGEILEANIEKEEANVKKLESNPISKFLNKTKISKVVEELKSLKEKHTSIAEESQELYEKYQEILKTTDKTEEQAVQEYINSEIGKEKPAEVVNEKLDAMEEKLEKSEQGLIGEAKSLYENFKKLSKTDQAKIVIGVALVGGAITVTGAGLGAGVLGMGLMQALNLPTLITLPNMGAYIAYEGVLIASVAGGSSLLLKRFAEKIKNVSTKEKQEIKNDNPQEKSTIGAAENPKASEEQEKLENSEVVKTTTEGGEQGKKEDVLEWLEPAFNKFDNFKDLYQEIDNKKAINSISSEEIKKRIDILRRTKKEDIKEGDYESIPEFEGLRDKVRELIGKNVLGVNEIKK